MKTQRAKPPKLELTGASPGRCQLTDPGRDYHYPVPARSGIERGIYVGHSTSLGSREFTVFDSNERLILRVEVAAEFATKSLTDLLWQFLRDADDPSAKPLRLV